MGYYKYIRLKTCQLPYNVGREVRNFEFILHVSAPKLEYRM